MPLSVDPPQVVCAGRRNGIEVDQLLPDAWGAAWLFCVKVSGRAAG